MAEVIAGLVAMAAQMARVVMVAISTATAVETEEETGGHGIFGQSWSLDGCERA